MYLAIHYNEPIEQLDETTRLKLIKSKYIPNSISEKNSHYLQNTIRDWREREIIDYLNGMSKSNPKYPTELKIAKAEYQAQTLQLTPNEYDYFKKQHIPQN